MKSLAACALVPILAFIFQDIGSDYGEMDWRTYGYVTWPTIAPHY